MGSPTCRCCGSSSMTMEARYCAACQTAWEDAPERETANKLGLYGVHRETSFQAFEKRHRAQHAAGVARG